MLLQYLTTDSYIINSYNICVTIACVMGESGYMSYWLITVVTFELITDKKRVAGGEGWLREGVAGGRGG